MNRAFQGRVHLLRCRRENDLRAVRHRLIDRVSQVFAVSDIFIPHCLHGVSHLRVDVILPERVAVQPAGVFRLGLVQKRDLQGMFFIILLFAENRQ